jgi:hypothetical protein
MRKKSIPRVLMYVTLCDALIFDLGLMAGCKGITALRVRKGLQDLLDRRRHSSQ